jgi:hypothetical protein
MVELYDESDIVSRCDDVVLCGIKKSRELQVAGLYWLSFEEKKKNWQSWVQKPKLAVLAVVG